MNCNSLIGLGKMLNDQQSEVAPARPRPTRLKPSPPPDDSYSGVVGSTVKYLLRTEVHTFAFSVAANAILSFFPFVLLLMTIIRRVFHSPVMYDVVVQLLRDSLPAGQDFVIRNLNALVEARNRAQVASLIILLFTSTGIFMPLEVALNRIWGFPSNRSYFGNQLISLGLAFTCGVLALLSVALTAGNIGLLESSLRSHGPFVVRLGGFSDDEGIRRFRQHRNFLPDLLGIAERQGTARAVLLDCGNYGIDVRRLEVRLHHGAAAAEFSGSLRPVCAVSQPDVLGIPLRTVDADGRPFVGPRLQPPRFSLDHVVRGG